GVSETYRGPLRRIETLIEAQKIKPRPAQDFKPIINELKPIAEQNEDIIAQTWAKARTNQLQNYIERSDALVAMESLKATAFSDAAEIARQRDEQRRLRGEWEINPIAARGQIEASALYTGTGGQPKRWRLVDPKTGRGIAYLELPKNSSIDPVQYYGKYVGIEAISYELQRGTVPPLPIYMVKNIRVMDPNTPSDPIIYRESIGGPLVPASQPASQQPATTSPVLDGSGEPAQ
ncbi:MAG: hypothetical protein FWC56_06155, partial [Phycisphaerae bacterium]|nr:hypothetical protein [Phycisphaerae bacterium]